MVGWRLFDLKTYKESGGLKQWLEMAAACCLVDFRATACSIFIGDAGKFQVTATSGDSNSIPRDSIILLGEGLAGQVAEEGRARIVGDPKRLGISGERKLASSILAPLIGRSGPLGILNIARRSGRGFSQSALARADAFAQQLSLGIENARLVDLMSETEKTKNLARIGQMTASVAHEIRNPLTGIKAAAQLILSEPDLAPEMAKQIVSDTNRLNSLCDEFLAYARPLNIDAKSVLLSECAARVVSRVAEDFRSKGIQLDHSLAKVNVFADENRLEQILFNLLRNALQATPPGGKVVIFADRSFVEVADNGIGMTSEIAEKVFDPFYTTKSDGTGLGMANVARIVQAHGWTISAQSAPGKGTCFRLNFEREARAA